MKLKYKIKDKIRDIKYALKNLKYWWPVIKEDRDWDYYYIHAILRHKLTAMRDALKGYSIEYNHPDSYEALVRCVEILDNFEKEEYNDLDDEKVQKDLIELYTLMADNIRYWWD